VHKEYPDDPSGMKWVQLKQGELPEGWTATPDPKGFTRTEYRSPTGEMGYSHPGEQSLQDALKYEGDTMGHCVGGYCDDVANGRSNIFSLRDAKGQPHVTIETAPVGAGNTPDSDELYEQAESMIYDKLGSFSHPNFGAEVEEAYKQLSQAPQPLRIVQIKGKGNAKPHDDYLPYVQDFVKSGQWSDVGDLQNSGLERVGPWKQELLKSGAAPERVEQFYTQLGHPEFVTKQQLSDATPGLSPQYDYKMLAEYLNNQAAPEGFAQGGSVTLPKEIRTLQDLRNIIASLS